MSVEIPNSKICLILPQGYRIQQVNSRRTDAEYWIIVKGNEPLPAGTLVESDPATGYLSYRPVAAKPGDAIPGFYALA